MPQQDAAESRPDDFSPDTTQPAGVPAEPAVIPPEPGDVPAPTDENTAEAVVVDEIAVDEIAAEAVVVDEIVVETAIVETIMVDEAPSGEASPADAGPPPVKEPRRLSRAERETVDRLHRRFSACGRCSYFIADCRVYLGEEALQTAMLAARDGWLRLEGNRTFDRLIMNSYGLDLGADYESLDASCPECRRRFVVVNLPDGPTRLKIQV